MRRILLIDDEPGLTRLLRMHLEKSGLYEVEEENNSLKAMAHIREFQPELIFLDLIMPGKGGDEIAAALDNDIFLNEIPVIFLTSIVTREDTQGDITNISGRQFLAKPVKASELLEVAQRMLW